MLTLVVLLKPISVGDNSQAFSSYCLQLSDTQTSGLCPSPCLGGAPCSTWEINAIELGPWVNSADEVLRNAELHVSSRPMANNVDEYLIAYNILR